MRNSEYKRALYLKQRFIENGHSVDDYLEPGYDAVAVHSDSTIFFCNEALVDLTGYSVDELIGCNSWMLFSPKSVSVVSAKLSAKSQDAYEAILRRKNGSTAIIELKGINIRVDDEPARVVLARLVRNE